jgi:hypothetical protein
VRQETKNTVRERVKDILYSLSEPDPVGGKGGQHQPAAGRFLHHSGCPSSKLQVSFCINNTADFYYTHIVCCANQFDIKYFNFLLYVQFQEMYCSQDAVIFKTWVCSLLGKQYKVQNAIDSVFNS